MGQLESSYQRKREILYSLYGDCLELIEKRCDPCFLYAWDAHGQVSSSIAQHNSVKQNNFCLRRSTTRRSSIKKPRLPSVKSKNAVKICDDVKEQKGQLVGILIN
uniref:Ovule protein n=1 Tax=Meloidogyne hapla TaxID=6305 RepID=A0A1I8BCN9_MELHA